MVEQKKPPLYMFIALDCDIVKIRDYAHRAVVNIYFQKSGVTCTRCNTDKCPHITFALGVADVKKTVWKRIREGWNLPDPEE